MSKIQAEIFKANDIRGVFEQSLNENDARLIGFALAAEALERNVTAIALGATADFPALHWRGH